MNAPPTRTEDLRERLRAALAAGVPGPGLTSVTLAAPELPCRGLPPLPPPYWFWSRPEGEPYLLGLGEAWRATTAGADRMAELAAAVAAVTADWETLATEAPGTRPVAFAGFAFDPDDPMEGPWNGFPNTVAAVPELLLQRRDGRCTLTFTAPAEAFQADTDALTRRWSTLLEQLFDGLAVPPEPSGSRTPLTRILTEPEDAEWLRLIEQANADIADRRLDKVVPARRLRVCAERRLAPARLLSALGYMYPSCMLFAANLGDRTVASATPERLLARYGTEVTSDAIGGTARRAPNDRHDQELGNALLESRKAGHEHALVVEAIREGLAPLCATLGGPVPPRLFRLRHLQHLWTPIRGEVARDAALLELAARLHPTPAVGGTPRGTAHDWLRAHSDLNRGWYTGAVGWLDRDGDGELSVLLRCAAVNGECADLYAGAGVVADSEPSAELAETELKLEAMLEALENA